MMQANAMAGSAPVAAPLKLQGRALVVARLIWSVLVVQAVVLFILSVPARYHQLSHPPADVRAQIANAGLSVPVYATYLTVIGCLLAVVCCAVAALIIWHRPNDRIGLLASLYLILLSFTNSPQMHAVADTYRALALPANVALLVCLLFLVGFFFVFPDGRFIPAWGRAPALLYAATAVLAFFITGASIAQDPPGWLGTMILIGGAFGIAAQVYRYIGVSDSLQRQQTKWVALSASCAIAISLVFAFLGPVLPTIGGSDPDPSYDLTSTTGITLATLFVPLGLGIAILRYRLWDIDIVVNRALVYGALTFGLAGLYLVVVGGIEALFQTQARLPISLGVTAVIAVLFAPLRDRLQRAVNRLMYGERDDPYRVITRVSERAGTAPAPAGVLQVISETVAAALKSPSVTIELQGPDASRLAAQPGSPDSASLRFPLEYQGEVAGQLLVAPRGPGERYSQADQRLLEDIAQQIGPAAHAVRLTADLQRSRERLVTAREEERRRLRRDLHDGLGPQLAALTLKIETIRNRFARDPELDSALVDLTTRIQSTLTDIRRLVYGLRPPALDEVGLISAMRQTASQYSGHREGGLVVSVEAPDSLPPLPAAVEVAVYRIAQEALANVVRHSGANRCWISLTLARSNTVLRLSVIDDGRGLPEEHHLGVGLVSMQERAEELGGRWRIASTPAAGTTVTVELPTPPADRPSASIAQSLAN